MKRIIALILLLAAGVAAARATGSTNTQTASDSSTVVLWHFDEGAGIIFHDASPYHNDGSASNASWVPGQFGSALHFDGATSYGILTNSASMKPQGDFTIESWFSVDTLFYNPDVPLGPPLPVLLGNLGPYPFGGGYQIYFTVNPLKVRFHYRTPSSWVGTSGIPITTAHQFYHIAVVYRELPVGAAVKIYLDGVARDSALFSEQVQYTETPTFYIGSNRDGVALGSGSPREFKGVIDEIRISNVAREPGEFGETDLVVSPSKLDFGLVELGGAAALNLTVSNGAFYDPLHVDSITSSNPRFVVAPDGFDLAPVTDHILPVTYEPAAAHADSGTLTVWAAGSGVGSASIHLSGTGFELSGAPIIHRVTDIAGDQGRQVRVAWYRSRYDAPGESLIVSEYSLWRRVDAPAGLASGVARPTDDFSSGLPRKTAVINGELWDFVVAVPAVQFREYAYVAPTLKNATYFGLNSSVFRVAAHTSTGEFFFSTTDSGSSYDDLFPAPPPSLEATPLDAKVMLSWDASEAEDVREYRVYRSTSPGLVPSPYSRIASLNKLVYLDSTVMADSTYYYLLTAVDSSWNEGAPSSVSGGVVILGAGEGQHLPHAFALHQNFPNPFNPGTEISYDLPIKSIVRLTVFNVLGEEIAVVAQGVEDAGFYRHSWLSQVGSGVYFARLEAAPTEGPSNRFVSVRKMLLIR
jgi:hypothetical protein